MSATNDSAITLVSPSVNGSIADDENPFAAHGLWLQVLLADDFIDEMSSDLQELSNTQDVSMISFMCCVNDLKIMSCCSCTMGVNWVLILVPPPLFM